MTARRYLNSYITVPDKDRAGDNLRPRVTEIAAIQRVAFGEEIPATNAAAALYDPEFIRCSGRCGQKKHYTAFDRCAGNTWRFCRDHRCKACRKLARLEPQLFTISASEEARLRAKPNNRRGRKGKLPELRTE